MAARKPTPAPDPNAPSAPTSDGAAAEVVNPEIEALRGGPVDLERELVAEDERLAADDAAEVLPPGEPGGYFETQAAIDLSRLDTIRVRTPFEEEVEDAFDDYELEQAPRDTTIERIVAAHEAVLAFRTDPTPEATGASGTPVIPSPADRIAAAPRRPRTLEDAKADTGYSTSGAEAELTGRPEVTRQPR